MDRQRPHNTSTRHDGRIQAQTRGGNPVALPADYTAQHVELGYAVTAHHCHGVTVATTDTIASSRMTREAFYVAMNRGRLSNRAYIDTNTCHGDLDSFGRKYEPGPPEPFANRSSPTWGAEKSAHALQSQLTARGAARQGPDRYRSRATQPSEQIGMSR